MGGCCASTTVKPHPDEEVIGEVADAGVVVAKSDSDNALQNLMHQPYSPLNRSFLKEYKDPEKDYKLLNELGRGHFASVRRAQSRSTGEIFAMKIIRKRDAHKNDEVVYSEVKILKAVKYHKNVISIVDFFCDAKNYYLVTELADGGDLFSNIVKRGNYTEHDAAKACSQLASALKYIHSRGVTHRDLKPENVLLTKDGDVKLCDFGLSKIIPAKDGGRSQMMKTICGTWAYCAPEVIQRRPYSTGVDNWTLGVLMFILLAGYHPFDVYGDMPEPKLLRKIVKVNYDFDDDVWKTVSAEAKLLITKLLVYDSSKRLSLDEFLKSPWIQKHSGTKAEDAKDLSHVGKRLEKFTNIKKKFRAAVLLTIATERFRRGSELPPPDIMEKLKAEAGDADGNHEMKLLEEGHNLAPSRDPSVDADADPVTPGDLNAILSGIPDDDASAVPRDSAI